MAAAQRVLHAGRLEERNRRLAPNPLPHDGPEAIFIGEVHGVTSTTV